MNCPGWLRNCSNWSASSSMHERHREHDMNSIYVLSIFSLIAAVIILVRLRFRVEVSVVSMEVESARWVEETRC